MTMTLSYTLPVDGPTVADLAAFLGQPDTEGLAPHLATASAYVRSYTRGVGFDDDGQCAEDLARVIVAAAARSYANPTHVIREEAGSWNAVPTQFSGFTLAEQAVLHTYRRR